MRREVLALVHDHELRVDRAATDVGEGLHLDDPRLHELGDLLLHLARLALLAEHELHVVEDRLHPGLELLLLGPGEEAEVAPERHDRARDEELLELMLLDGEVQSRDEGEERLARAGAPHERDEADRRVEEEVERDPLLEVARRDPEDLLLREDERTHDLGLGRRAPPDRGALGARAVPEEDALVRVELEPRELEPVLLEEAPERVLVDVHLAPAGVELLDGGDLVGLVVLGVDPEGVRLDPHVHVLGDERDRLPLLEELVGDREDPVVGRVALEPRLYEDERLEIDPERAALVVDLDARPEPAAALARPVEDPYHLARVPSELVVLRLELVELL